MGYFPYQQLTNNDKERNHSHSRGLGITFPTHNALNQASQDIKLSRSSSLISPIDQDQERIEPEAYPLTPTNGLAISALSADDSEARTSQFYGPIKRPPIDSWSGLIFSTPGRQARVPGAHKPNKTRRLTKSRIRNRADSLHGVCGAHGFTFDLDDGEEVKQKLKQKGHQQNEEVHQSSDVTAIPTISGRIESTDGLDQDAIDYDTFAPRTAIEVSTIRPVDNRETTVFFRDTPPSVSALAALRQAVYGEPEDDSDSSSFDSNSDTLSDMSSVEHLWKPATACYNFSQHGNRNSIGLPLARKIYTWGGSPEPLSPTDFLDEIEQPVSPKHTRLSPSHESNKTSSHETASCTTFLTSKFNSRPRPPAHLETYPPNDRSILRTTHITVQLNRPDRPTNKIPARKQQSIKHVEPSTESLLRPPIYNPTVSKIQQFVDHAPHDVQTSRPTSAFGSAKRWRCCRCRAHTIVENVTCANLRCQHGKCGRNCVVEVMPKVVDGALVAVREAHRSLRCAWGPGRGEWKLGRREVDRREGKTVRIVSDRDE